MRKLISFVFVAATMLLLSTASMAQQSEIPKGYIPLDKGLSDEYIASLYQKGEQKVYSGVQTKYIGMPCGGIGAGQVEILGSGKFCFYSEIYNVHHKQNGGTLAGNGYEYINPTVHESVIENNFAIAIQEGNGEQKVYALNSDSFDDIHFVGEYPIAKLEYKKRGEKLPLEISSEIFTSFVPHDVRASTNPLVMMKVTFKNNSKSKVKASLAGWMKGVEFADEGGVKYQNVANATKEFKSISFTMFPSDADSSVESHKQFGELAIAILNKDATIVSTADSAVDILKNRGGDSSAQSAASPYGGGVYQDIVLSPNEQREITFVLSWYFPNFDAHLYEVVTGGMVYPKHHVPGYVGRIYNNWYDSAADVVEYAAKNQRDIYKKTTLFRDTYFDTTMPYWLTNRMIMSVSILAAGNVSIWENGRFYAFEGINFCFGTCGHVFNFVDAIARLFPELERSVRLMQDFNPEQAFHPTNGRISFRGLGGENEIHYRWASDSQSGYILKAYREHLMSKDNSFLDSIWERVKLAMAYQIFKDGAEIGLRPNGVLECEQTFWDPMWYGPNPYNNTLYLAALKACREMALLQNEPDLAARYNALYMEGRDYMDTVMWNGEYYSHLYPNGIPGKHGIFNGSKLMSEVDRMASCYAEAFNSGEPTYFRSDACDANQLWGQNWAFQLGLGDILSQENCEKAAESIFKYTWTPNISTVYDVAPARRRILAAPGEGAMVNAFWPNDPIQPFENTHSKSDVWTGLEYEAACDMINAGRLDDALVVIKAVDDRYDGAKRNPWNEIEGADHYVRSMHAWNIQQCLNGYFYDGPKGILKFNPRLTPECFKSFFSAAEGWGSYSQSYDAGKVNYSLELKFGDLHLNKFILPELIPEAEYECTVNGKRVNVKYQVKDGEIILDLNGLNLAANDTLIIRNI